MQRHDRRVPVSFFSRYTKDIVAFADRFTEGKIVSVLEGGYSDRALTSAAMGHVVGLLDREGDAAWWAEHELVNVRRPSIIFDDTDVKIEKATKKKRTGRIAPFPSELNNHAHLARTHALLAHFEGTPLDSIAPSATSTPQQASRMTLRDRRKQPSSGVEEDVMVTPPTRKPVRGRATGTTPRSTPVEVKDEQIVAPPHVEVVSHNERDLIRSTQRLEVDAMENKVDTSIPEIEKATEALPPSRLLPKEDPSKVFLRFTRPPQSVSLPASQSLYPALPSSTLPGSDRMAYRERGDKEGSADISTGSETEYASARSELSNVEDYKKERSPE